jgi:hypothetical protein
MKYGNRPFKYVKLFLAIFFIECTSKIITLESQKKFSLAFGFMVITNEPVKLSMLDLV